MVASEGRLAYESAGEGVPIVLLHAFPLSGAMWRAELERFAHVGRVIAPDLPGFGKSKRQDAPSISLMASAVAALLDRLSAEEPVILGGLSMGGYVAFEFVRQFPDRVRALGLFATRAAPDTPEARAARVKTAQKIQREGLPALAASILPRLLGRSTLASKPSLVEAVRAAMLSNDPAGVVASLQAMAGRNDSTPLLPSLTCPTLVVSGEEDILIPRAETERLQRCIPGALLDVIPGAGHLVNLEQPGLFHEVVERWLPVALKGAPSRGAPPNASVGRGAGCDRSGGGGAVPPRVAGSGKEERT